MESLNAASQVSIDIQGIHFHDSEDSHWGLPTQKLSSFTGNQVIRPGLCHDLNWTHCFRRWCLEWIPDSYPPLMIHSFF